MVFDSILQHERLVGVGARALGPGAASGADRSDYGLNLPP